MRSRMMLQVEVRVGPVADPASYIDSVSWGQFGTVQKSSLLLTLMMVLVAFNDLSSTAGKSRALSEGLWGRAFLTTYNSASDEERLRMVEGLGKGAGLAILAVPMADAFIFSQAQFQRESSSASCPTTSVWKEQ